MLELSVVCARILKAEFGGAHEIFLTTTVAYCSQGKSCIILPRYYIIISTNHQ